MILYLPPFGSKFKRKSKGMIADGWKRNTLRALEQEKEIANLCQTHHCGFFHHPSFGLSSAASICWSILSSCPNTFPNFSICRWYNLWMLVDRSVKNLRNFSPWLGRCTKDKVISLKEVKYGSIYLRKMYFTLQIFQKANIASNRMGCRNEPCSGSVCHALFTWCDYDTYMLLRMLALET